MTDTRLEQETPDPKRIKEIEREKTNYQRDHDPGRIGQVEEEKKKEREKEKEKGRSKEAESTGSR